MSFDELACVCAWSFFSPAEAKAREPPTKKRPREEDDREYIEWCVVVIGLLACDSAVAIYLRIDIVVLMASLARIVKAPAAAKGNNIERRTNNKIKYTYLETIKLIYFNSMFVSCVLFILSICRL